MDEILATYNGEKEMLISILQDVQAKYNYLPRNALERVSSQLDIPIGQIFAVATFFKAFSLTPRGRHIVSVCTGTACHVKWAAEIQGKLSRQLGVEPGQTTPDGQFTLETVRCVGCCSLAPVVVIGEETFGNLTQEELTKLLSRYQAEP